MKDSIFGYEVGALELLKEQMPVLERKVNRCDPDAIRYIRSTALNNCRARANGEIELKTFVNNRKNISDAVEKFIEKCQISPRK